MSVKDEPRSRIERAYRTDDRFLIMVVAATAKGMGLYTFRKTRRRTAPIYVAANDSATLDRFDARVVELYRELDAKFAELAIDFLKTNTGVDLSQYKP